MSEYKQYKIETIQDILEAVNTDNVDNFLKDFEGFLRMQVSLQGFSDVIGEANEVSKEDSKIDLTSFTWIDDNKHKISINIHSKGEENENEDEEA